MKTKNKTKPFSVLERRRLNIIFSLIVTATGISVYAQDGKTGIAQATTLVGGYFDTAVLLMYAVGGIVGIIGAVKVYNAWSHGDQQTNKMAASWFSACVFLVVVAAVLKSFFNLT